MNFQMLEFEAEHLFEHFIFYKLMEDNDNF